MARVCSDGFSHVNISFFATALVDEDDDNSTSHDARSLQVQNEGGGVMFYGEEIGRCEGVPVSLKSSYPE